MAFGSYLQNIDDIPLRTRLMSEYKDLLIYVCTYNKQYIECMGPTIEIRFLTRVQVGKLLHML